MFPLAFLKAVDATMKRMEKFTSDCLLRQGSYRPPTRKQMKRLWNGMRNQAGAEWIPKRFTNKLLKK